jgi:multiple antibiotic resistance protein
VFYRYLGDLLARLKPATIAIMARLGGLILATLGFQMFLNGIRNFYA